MSDNARFKWRWAKLPWYQHRWERGWGQIMQNKMFKLNPASNFISHTNPRWRERDLGDCSKLWVNLGARWVGWGQLVQIQPLPLSFPDLRSSPFPSADLLTNPSPFNWFNLLSFADCWRLGGGYASVVVILLFSSNCSSCEEVDMLLVGRGTGEGGDKMRRSLSSDQEGDIGDGRKWL